MYELDQIHTSFNTDHGLYSYRVMLFGLKNIGASYQKLVNTIFKDLLGQKVEAYIDDMVVKTISHPNHIEDLEDAIS